MQAYCVACGTLTEIGFQSVITVSNYDLYGDGGLRDADPSSATPDWIDGAEVFGFWCPECKEWADDNIEIK